MIAFLKALPFGIFLTLLVGLFIGSGGATGGLLNVQKHDLIIRELSINFDFYWSWALFLIGTGLAWAILAMMGD